MSPKQKTDNSNLGPAGDTTAGPISLSEITAINPSFLDLIATPKPSNKDESHSSVKRCPEEIAKQLQISQKRRPLLSSHETIESYKNENLQLKVQLHQLKQASSKEIENFDTDGIKKDLIADLMNRNEDLRKRLDEREKRDRAEEREKKSMQRDAMCQTNLDSLNIDELIKASITLKKMNEQQLYGTHKPQPQPQLVDQPLHKVDTPAQHQTVSQLTYPGVRMHKRFGSTKHLSTDEKDLLETLYRVDGIMTTVLDKLKAVADTH